MAATAAIRSTPSRPLLDSVMLQACEGEPALQVGTNHALAQDDVRRAGLVAALGLVAAAVSAPAAAAEAPPAARRSVTVIPGARYQAGWLRRLFLGAHWRDAWNTAIEVPVLDLSTFDGGLTPERQGGGLETSNLRFESGNGRTWVFRSVDKNPTRVLDPETAEGIIGDITQDLTSGAYPCASLIVAPLLEAAGVPHATPQLMVMPDDPRLGEFRSTFAGMLGGLEERIEHKIPGVKKVEDTLSLFERLDERSDERVDARAYLRVRLMDVLVGDWDRHIDQYRWVRFDESDGRVWRVVPRDRDESFSRFDGALPSIAEYYGKPIVGWGTTYPPIDKITFAGRYTDRRFLVPLERAAWEAVTADLVAKLTDAVISEAVHRLPAPMYAESGEGLERALRSRRDLLPEASREFYRLLAHDVDLRGTTGGEDFELERQAGGAVSVAIYARQEKTGEREATPFFRRTFLPEETSEIRLYAMGGKDRVAVQGSGSGAITLRVISPPGTSEIVDRSAPSATKVYEPLAPVQIPADKLETRQKVDPRVDERVRYEVFRDWGRDYLFFPQFSYDGTRGLMLGGILQRTGYGFALDPYASQMSFGAAWSTKLSRPRLEYGGDFRTRSPVRPLLYLAYSGIEIAKFYGFGNDTLRDSNLVSSGFYDVHQDQIIVNPMVEVPLVGPVRGRAGALFKHVSSVDQTGLIGNVQPSGSGGMTLASAEAGLAFDESSGTYGSQRGFAVHVTGRHTPSIFSNPAAFSKVRGEVSAIYGTRILTNVLLSAHVSGERNWGRYPFFEAAFLGGTASRSTLDLTGASTGNLLRGYDLNRFAGDAAVAANTELNVELGKYSALLPLRYGVFGLCDVGRVFLAGESSSTWHTGVGGGLWIGLFARSPYFQLAGSLKAALVRSDEGTSFYLFSGFGF